MKQLLSHLPRAALALLLAGIAAVPAAAVQAALDPPIATRAPLPFGPGERAEYQVKLGGIGVGRGSMEVLGQEVVQGEQTLHARLRVHGGVPWLGARVDDKFESWIDVDGLFSRRFKQDQHELRFRRNRVYDFFPEARTYRRVDNGEVGTLPTDRPLDDVAMLYYARTLPLRIGDTYTLNRYFKADGNPVVLRVLRRETVRVPAGTFETVVVQPIIKTDGLFGEGGKAEVYFTDDARRIMVMMKSEIPKFPGALTLHLTSYRPGGAPSIP